MRDAFHQAAVADEAIGAVIHQGLAEAGGHHAFGQGHADGIGETLAERAGGGLDARVFAVFRMPGGNRVQLAEPLDVLDAHAVIAGEVQQRVQQHRAVAVRQHEAVAVRPARIGGIEFQHPAVERGGNVGHAHRHAGVAGFRGLDGIDGQRADGVGHAPLGGHRPSQDRSLDGEGGVVGRRIARACHGALLVAGRVTGRLRLGQYPGTKPWGVERWRWPVCLPVWLPVFSAG